MVGKLNTRRYLGTAEAKSREVALPECGFLAKNDPLKRRSEVPLSGQPGRVL